MLRELDFDFDRILSGSTIDDDTLAANPVEWIEHNFYSLDTGKKIVLHPRQRNVLRKMLQRDERGKFVYDTLVYGNIKKSGKSSIAAALAHWVASTRPNAHVILTANKEKQAASRVGYYLRQAIKLAQKHEAETHPVHGIYVPKRESGKLVYPNGSIVEPIPMSDAGEAGAAPDVIIFDELWGYYLPKHENFFSEMTLSPTKQGQSFRFISTYAGYVGVSVVLERLYERGVKQGERIDDVDKLYANGPLVCYWNDDPYLSWQTEEYYESERLTLTPSQFARLHRNEWVASTDTFIDKVTWDVCADDYTYNDDILIVGVDAATSGDTFAITSVFKRWHDDTPYVYHYDTRVFTAPKGGQIDFNEPMGYLERLCSERPVYAVTYDPYQLHQPMLDFRRLNLCRVIPFEQGKDRLIADKQLRDLIVKRQIHHTGHPLLTEHVLNAGANITGQNDNKLRLVKLNDHRKIDAAVALSMASKLAIDFNI